MFKECREGAKSWQSKGEETWCAGMLIALKHRTALYLLNRRRIPLSEWEVHLGV